MTDITVKAAREKETVDPISGALALMIAIFAVTIGAYVGVRAFSVYSVTIHSAEKSENVQRINELNDSLRTLSSWGQVTRDRLEQMEQANQATIKGLASRIRELERRKDSHVTWTDNMPIVSPRAMFPGTFFAEDGTVSISASGIPCAGGAPPPECK